MTHGSQNSIYFRRSLDAPPSPPQSGLLRVVNAAKKRTSNLFSDAFFTHTRGIHSGRKATTKPPVRKTGGNAHDNIENGTQTSNNPACMFLMARVNSKARQTHAAPCLDVLPPHVLLVLRSALLASTSATRSRNNGGISVNKNHFFFFGPPRQLSSKFFLFLSP